MITLYAKDITWENRVNILTQDQIYVFAKQHRRILRLEGAVDYIITDSPILMCICYQPKKYFESFVPLVEEVWDKYDNINFYLARDTPYSQTGRNQNEEEAYRIDRMIKNLLDYNDVHYNTVGISHPNLIDTLYHQSTHMDL